EDKSMSAVYEKLIFERNKNMTTKMEDFLKTEKTYFVIVGAGHLVGDKGILDLFIKKGYSVEQL
ncbi:MAG: TraB/GumN family protein, partial [Nitrospirota bacterium]